MSDNVAITPGAGEKVATREVTYSGEPAQLQTVGLAVTSGPNDAKVATDISESNPLPVGVYGELLEALEAMRMAVASLTRTIGMALPNAQGFPIMEARQLVPGNFSANVFQGTAANLQMTATLAASQVLATLTNQAQMGGFAAQDQIPALMRMQADNLRRNITVT